MHFFAWKKCTLQIKFQLNVFLRVWIDDRSTSVQVMAWHSQETSHNVNQCWPSSVTSYSVTRPQWVNWVSLVNVPKMIKCITTSIVYTCSFGACKSKSHVSVTDMQIKITQGDKYWGHDCQWKIEMGVILPPKGKTHKFVTLLTGNSINGMIHAILAEPRSCNWAKLTLFISPPQAGTLDKMINSLAPGRFEWNFRWFSSQF